MRKTVAIFGIPIDDLDTEQTLNRIEEFIRSRRYHQVATANTDFLIRAHADPELRAILRDADLVVPDGMPVVIASRWLRAGLSERVTGADIVPRLATMAAENGYRIFMLGGRQDVAFKARERLIRNNPNLQIVGCISPPLAHIVEMDNDAILAEIEQAAPDILLVAFGNPKQEKWIHMHRNRLKVPVCIGVGGTFDFLAGVTTRAPLWMQRSGLEWFHRLCHDPGRLGRRYANDLVRFTRFIGVQMWAMRRVRLDFRVQRLVEARISDFVILSVVGPLDKRLLPSLQLAADQALNSGAHLILDLQATSSVDSSALGTLMNLPKRAAYMSREIRLVGLTSRTRHVLTLFGARDRLNLYSTVAEAINGNKMGGLFITVAVHEEKALVVMRGSTDESHLDLIERKLMEIPMFVREVDVDMRNISYLDCGALAKLKHFANDMNKREGRMRIAPNLLITAFLAREELLNKFEITDKPFIIPLGRPAASALPVILDQSSQKTEQHP